MATNVIALIHWELDRGGPVLRVRRSRAELPLADLRFSHDEDRDTVVEVSAGSSEKYWPLADGQLGNRIEALCWPNATVPPADQPACRRESALRGSLPNAFVHGLLPEAAVRFAD